MVGSGNPLGGYWVITLCCQYYCVLSSVFIFGIQINISHTSKGTQTQNNHDKVLSAFIFCGKMWNFLSTCEWFLEKMVQLKPSNKWVTPILITKYKCFGCIFVWDLTLTKLNNFFFHSKTILLAKQEGSANNFYFTLKRIQILKQREITA